MKILVIITAIILLVVGGYFLFNGGDNLEEVINVPDPNQELPIDLSLKDDKDLKSIWRTTILTDIRTGETFTIDQFDRPILLESFAVWCPTCTKQQWEISDLHKEIGNKVVSISLDTDPNEDREKVLTHITANNFDWYYAIAPKEVTQSLIDEFGVTVANAPQAPIVLIDKDKNARLLKNGVKSSSELKGELGL